MLLQIGNDSMKWYSMKKHVPPTGQDLLLRLMKGGEEESLYEVYSIGRLEMYGTDNSDVKLWDVDKIDHRDLIPGFYVSHFALIDPVEVE